MNQTVSQLFVVLSATAFVVGCFVCDVGHRYPVTTSGYVSCVGQLVDFESDHPWFENWVDRDGNDSHDDGSSPRAVFRIVSPTNQAGRIVGILIKYEGHDPSFGCNVGSKGKIFSFELPEDFLAGNFGTIDNNNVRKLKIEPESESDGARRSCAEPAASEIKFQK